MRSDVFGTSWLETDGAATSEDLVHSRKPGNSVKSVDSYQPGSPARLHLCSGRQVLDAGHGARALSLIAEILGDEGKTASVAISGELLAESPRRTSGVKALVSLELSDAEQLPFPDSAFDSSTADSTLHHLAHPI